MTQGRKLINVLKRKGMTTMELLMLGISTCPWKRLSEQLREGEVLTRNKNQQGLLVYRVKSKTPA